MKHTSHVSSCKLPAAGLIRHCTQITLSSNTHVDRRSGYATGVNIFTRDCRAPFSAIMSFIDWPLAWDIVVRLQSRNSPRRFCFTSGRVINLYDHTEQVIKCFRRKNKCRRQDSPGAILPSAGKQNLYRWCTSSSLFLFTVCIYHKVSKITFNLKNVFRDKGHIRFSYLQTHLILKHY